MSKAKYREFYNKYLSRIEANEEELNSSIFNKKPSNLFNILICLIIFFVGSLCFIIPFFINKYPKNIDFFVATSSCIYKINQKNQHFVINANDYCFIANILIGVLSSAIITIIGSIRSKYISELKDWKERYWEKLYRNLNNLKSAYENAEDLGIWLHEYNYEKKLQILESIGRQSETIYLSCILVKYLVNDKHLIKCKVNIVEKINNLLKENKEVCDIAIKQVDEEIFSRFKKLYTDASFIIYDLFNDFCEKLGDRLDRIESHVMKNKDNAGVKYTAEYYMNDYKKSEGDDYEIIIGYDTHKIKSPNNIETYEILQNGIKEKVFMDINIKGDDVIISGSGLENTKLYVVVC